MFNVESQTIKEMVAQNYKAASVFEKYSLDFCCKGGRTISEACREKNIDPSAVITDLSRLNESAGTSVQRFTQWNTDLLTSYIVENHHGFIRNTIPTILAHTRKVAMVHGERHPEIKKVADIFGAVASDLMNHMQKEEKILFPYIVALFHSLHDNTPVPPAPFGSVGNPIAMMEHEHDAVGTMMYKIRELTNTYAPPVDACTMYRVTLQELNEFERDLHQHIHLENNILFPKAAEMEHALSAKN